MKRRERHLYQYWSLLPWICGQYVIWVEVRKWCLALPLNKGNTTGATQGAGTAHCSGTHEFNLGFLGDGHLPQSSSVLCIVLYVDHCLFVWPIYGMSYFELRLLIPPLWYLQAVSIKLVHVILFAMTIFTLILST